jgi:SAM-dependent methyltransferase
MTTTDYHELIDHYEACLDRHGDTHLGVDWPNEADALTRYRVMLEIVAPPTPGSRATLLDFGCGAGGLLDHMRATGANEVEYLGLDASPKFVALCQQKFPGIDFFQQDVLADATPLPAVDYAVLNGVLTEKRGLSQEAMLDYAARLLERVFASVRVGMAFNVMSWHVDWRRDDLFHVPFDTMAAVVRDRLSRHYRFRSDYGLYEYTTYVYREPR